MAAHGASSAATINWKNNTSGNWSDTANWVQDTVPNAAGTVARYTHSGTASAGGAATLDQQQQHHRHHQPEPQPPLERRQYGPPDGHRFVRLHIEGGE